MFSTTIKRSVATLGVVAGLLAAAGPAGAMPAGTAPPLHNDALTVKPKAKAGTISGEEMAAAIAGKPVSSWSWGMSQSGAGHVAAAGPASTVASGQHIPAAVLTAAAPTEELYGIYFSKAEGTQVGSEGVKAPTKAPAPIDSGPGDDNIW